MDILLVQGDENLSRLWAGFLHRSGISVTRAATQQEAVACLRFRAFDALVLDVLLPDGGAMTIADLASYRYPDIPIIAVTRSSFFSDGSIFELIPNARSVMRVPVCPPDLAAVVEHYATRGVDGCPH